jgi:sodium-coupled neutral amino acid transporter 11
MSESQKLLHEHPSSDSDSEPEPAPDRHASPSHSSASSRPTSTSPAPAIGRPNGRPGGHPKRQSSFAQPRPDGIPRTPNRVRFEPDPVLGSMNGNRPDTEWLELEGDDYLASNGHAEGQERVQRLPLLTGIEAPSVTVATEDFNPEDHLESARPRSGLSSSFMNMANSIMCVHIF